MEALRILIVEDEFIIASNLKEMLEELGYAPYEPAGSLKEAREALAAKEIDLAILDINLEGKQEGIAIGKLIHEQFHFPFIYLTSNGDKATVDAAKQTQPRAYLVKPFSSEDIYAAIETAVTGYDKGDAAADEDPVGILSESFFIRLGSKYHKVDIKDISYVEADGKMMNIHTRNGQKFTIRTSLESLYNQLKPFGFVRIHRSFCINAHHLSAINSEFVVVDKREVPLGRNFRDELLAKVKTLS